MTSDLEDYLTLSAPSEGIYKEKGSKFLAFAYPVATEEEVKAQLEELKKQYHDARHHCYAYVLGVNRDNFRANDDGEPNHSAGDPILGQINSKQLTNTLVVVVRYFGGTKLGVGGLINAYKIATEEALNSATIVKIAITYPVKISYSYDATNEVMRLVNDFDIRINDQQFEAACMLAGEVKINFRKNLQEKIQLLKDTGHAVELITDAH